MLYPKFIDNSIESLDRLGLPFSFSWMGALFKQHIMVCNSHRDTFKIALIFLQCVLLLWSIVKYYKSTWNYKILSSKSWVINCIISEVDCILCLFSTKGTWIFIQQISEFIDFINSIFKIENPEQAEIPFLNKFSFSGLISTLYLLNFIH